MEKSWDVLADEKGKEMNNFRHDNCLSTFTVEQEVTEEEDGLLEAFLQSKKTRRNSHL
jgi:hypothetical protein